jgi:ABC-2 type transport system permease protein
MLYTYKFAYSTTIINMIFTVVYLILFGTMFKSADIPSLAPYGGDFIAFALVGSMGWSLLWNVTNSVSFSLRNEMLMGTLESILITPTNVYTIMLSYIIFGSIFGLLSMLILFLLGFYGFGVIVFSTANIYTIIIFGISIIMMAGLGMIFGGLTLKYKNIGQTIPLIQGIAMFFCSVYFPISILPESLQSFAKVIPFYYSIEGMRVSLTADGLTSELLYYITILTALAIIFTILGFILLQRGLNKAKKDGSLSFY